MKKSSLRLSCVIISILCLCSTLSTLAQSLAIDSLSGPITQNEINSFKAYMATQCPPPNGWTLCGGTISHNTWADAAGGNILEAFGLMYEATGDITVLTNMIHWTDTCVSQRNDLMSAANGGQRVMWTNGIAKVWCPEPPTNDYAGGENGDTKAHILYTALLILQNPSLWNQTIPDGDPFGYGATYFQRATNYVHKCDEANDNYDYIFILPNNTIGNPPLWPAGFHTMNANNIRAMMWGDFQRSAQCHEILGDDPSRVSFYDTVMKTDSSACINGMAGYHPTTVNGDPVYDWAYYPTSVYPNTVENVGHGAYDMIGVWRVYYRSVYNYSLSTVKPFANALIDVMNVSTNTFSGNVDGSGTTQNYMQQQWLLLADLRSSVYDVVAQADLVSGRYKTSPYMTATILWMKNRRLQEFSVAAIPSSQSVVAGSGTSYTVSVQPLAGFTGTVGLTVSGLPSGATASFNHSSVNLSTINAFETNVTLTVNTTASTPQGTYNLTITGTSGSVTQTATVSLVVTAPPDFSISASPSSQTVVAGNSTNYTVNVGNLNGFTGTVTFSASGLPSGATANFNPTSSGAPGSSTMTVGTATSTPVGTSTLTVTGTSGSLAHNTTVSLVVNPIPDFSLSASPGSLTIVQGGNGSSTITVNPINGFSGSVSLSASGLPSGVTASFNPSSTTSTSTLTLTASSSAAIGTATVTVTGTSGSLQHTTTISLTVNVSGGGLPSGWADTDIGAVGLAGSASYNNGTFTVSGAGSDIWTAADGFNYAYESVSGDQTVIARVVSETGSQSYAKAGVMIRETLATNSVEASVLLTPTNGVAMEVRPTTGAASINVAGWVRNILPPQWVKLVRAGSTFTASYSADGATWTQIASTNVTMATSATAGLAVSAHTTTALNTATFDNVSIGNSFTGVYQLQNEASGLVLNNQGSLTNGSPITQWTSVSSSNLDWTFIAVSNGYYQINSYKSGKDAVVQSASTSPGAGIIQWSFGSSGDDQWQPVQNSDGSYTFYNLHSGLVLADPGSSTSNTTQMDQETANSGSNQKWKLLQQ
jgi:hypothetical protein